MRGSHDSEWGDVLARHLPDGPEDLGPCAPRPMPGGWPGVYILNGKEDTHAFQYVHLGYERFGADGTWFVVEFNINVSEKWRLTVRGRKLWRIFLNLHQHKLEWIKKADRDFADDGKPVITGIAVELVPEEAARVVPARREVAEERDAAYG